MFYGNDFGADNRRRVPGTRKTYEPKALTSLHLRILQLKAGGLSNKRIAQLCDCTPQTVSNVVCSELGEQKLRALHAQRDLEVIDVKAELERAARKGVLLLHEALDEERELSTKDLVSTALAAIDRAGYSPKNVHLHAHQHQHFTAEEISEINQKAAEARQRAIESGVVVDAEIVAEKEED